MGAQQWDGRGVGHLGASRCGRCAFSVHTAHYTRCQLSRRTTHCDVPIMLDTSTMQTGHRPPPYSAVDYYGMVCAECMQRTCEV
jgi:hypothetical protein